MFQSSDDDSQESTQGNSKGEVNVIKVVSIARFVCGVCEKDYASKEKFDEHMKRHDAAIDGKKPDNELNPEENQEEQENEVDEEMDSESVVKEIENLVIVDKIIDSFVDTAFRAMRPNEAPETTKAEDQYNLLFRKYAKISDANTVLTRANQNRLEIIEELEKLRTDAASIEEALHTTRKANQGLAERLRMKDTETEAMEEIIDNLKKKAKADAATAADQAKNIRAMEEELGVWDEEEEDEEVTELQNEWISDDVRRQNEITIRCEKCNYKTNNPTRLKGHMTRHNGYVCDKCKKVFKSQADLNNHIQEDHRPDLFKCTMCSKQLTSKNKLSQHMNSKHPQNPPIGHSQWPQHKNNSNDYSCTQCGSGFESLNELKEHIMLLLRRRITTRIVMVSCCQTSHADTTCKAGVISKYARSLMTLNLNISRMSASGCHCAPEASSVSSLPGALATSTTEALGSSRRGSRMGR